MVGVAPLFTAFVFGIHIVMVNLGIGLAWLVPYFKWRGDRGEREFGDAARTLMKFYAATYGVAGVFGTAFTVFLLSYYPRFIGLAGHLAMIPLGLSILMIALHFFAIVAYWYGWDRWSRSVHNLIGILLGVSALLIPLGFRAIFAFLNIPAGLSFDSATGRLYLDVWSAITRNPTFLPLYLKSIAAAFTATFITVAGAYAYKASRVADEAERKAALRIARTLIVPALAGLVLVAIFGLWYALTLQDIPYKFNNIFASLGWSVGDGVAHFNVSWLFVLKMLLVVVQFAVLIYALRLRDTISPTLGRIMFYTGIVALATIAAGEYVNAFSQYPFFIAIWPDILTGNVPVTKLADYGINIPATALPTIVNTVNSLVLLEGGATVDGIVKSLGLAGSISTRGAVNPIAATTEVVTVTVVFLVLLLAAVAYLLYILLVPAKKS